MRRTVAALAFLLGAAPAMWAQTPSVPKGSAEILQELTTFRNTGSVLFVAAHPDDEDSQLIAYLSKGAGYRTAYLSLNRGEGGQNLIGPEFGDELGVIRTYELLAARHVDGAQQFFSRAVDFGYSKSYQDSLRRWGHDEILSDVVRVIREFRPDVIITRFSTQPGATHGHHTASAVLALEAFKVAADPNEIPDGLPPWQAKRIVWDISRFGGGPPPEGAPRHDGAAGASQQASSLVRLNIGGYNPILGESYGEIAALSRSNHRTQGYGSVGSRGSRYDYFRLLAGDPARNDIFDGIDATWNRYPGGAEIARMADQAVDAFDPKDPSKSVPALLAIHSAISRVQAVSLGEAPEAGAPFEPAIAYRKSQLERIVQACLGLYLETNLASAEVVPGETVRLTATAMDRSGVPVRWDGAAAAGRDLKESDVVSSNRAAIDLRSNQVAIRVLDVKLPATMPISQPYWLVEEGTPNRFRVDDPSLIGRPENPPPLVVTDTFTVDGEKLSLESDPVQVTADPARGEIRRDMAVVSPVTLAFADNVALLAPGASRQVSVEVTAMRPGVSGTVHIEAPKDAAWSVSPAGQPFHFASQGKSVRLDFTVTAPPRADAVSMTAVAEVGGVRYDNGRVEFHYEHVPFILLQPAARLRAVSLDLAIRGKQVGYLPGAGDDIPAALARMGYEVVTLSGDDLTAENLKSLDAVVIGIRAFNTRDDLAPHLAGLFAYVQDGGTVVEQYNTPNGLKTRQLGPYPLELDRDLPDHRVTDYNAPMTFLAPESPVLTTPNRIDQADFSGWIQERGLNFPSEWDSRYTPILSCSDAGEDPLTSGLLVAKYGRGYFVVTGLSFFRELPAGVPGAYRLFANLVSLGK